MKPSEDLETEILHHLLNHLKGCLEYCKEQNGMNYCKNCGLDGEIVDLYTGDKDK